MPGYDVTEDSVFDLSGSIASIYSPSDGAWDVSIGGLPFLLMNSPERPFGRQTSQFRRERIDQERDPGEQSLDSGLWLRSFAALHYGAGQRAVEPLEIDPAVARFRYWKSAGVDPWSAGETTLGVAVSELRASGSSTQHVLGIGGGDVLHATGTTLSHVTSTGTVTSVTWGGSGTISCLDSDGTNYYASDSTGIYKGALPTSAGSKVWDTGATTVARFVKSRLMAGIGASLYELTGTGPALPTALFTHPASGWTWTDIAEGPSSIYFAGYAGDQSAVYRSSITASGGTITLSAPLVVADMPRGEKVQTIYSYLGRYLVVGTNLGLRIAEVSDAGDLAVGPLIFTCSGGVKDAVGFDRFLYVTGGSDTTANDGATAPGVYRVDLSVEVEPLRFAYAQEAVGAGSSATAGVTRSGELLFFCVPGQGLYAQDPDGDYVTEGWIEYGRITFGTLEPKAWQTVLLRGSTPAGTAISLYASTTGEGDPSLWPPLGSLTETATDGEFSTLTAAPAPTRELYLAVKMTGTASVRPTLAGVSVRAVPAPRRTRLTEVPLACFDFEQDRNGKKHGVNGGAWLRLQALEELEDSGRPITWQDFTTGERRAAVVEQVGWSRLTPPSRGNDNAGGVLTVLLRLL